MSQTTQKDEIEIDIWELLQTLFLKAWILVAAAIVLGGIIFAYTKIFVTPIYTSTTQIYILNKQNESGLTSSDMQTSTLLTKDYAQMVKSRNVTEEVIDKLGLNMSHEQLLSKMTVSTLTDTRIIAISVSDPDPQRAHDIAKEIQIVASIHIQKVMDSRAVNVVEDANIPFAPVSPNAKRNAMMGSFAGFIIAAAVISVIHLVNDTIKTPEDVERYLGLSTLGSIPVKDAGKKKNGKRFKSRQRSVPDIS